MDQRIPPVLHPLLQAYLQQMEQEMPGRIAAFYLEGSIALGGFNPRLSDVDFVATLSGEATPADFEKIQKIHTVVEKQYPKWKLSGRYFQPGDLGCLEHTSEPFLNYQDGKLYWADQFGLSSVTWWILKNRGIAVLGPDPLTLPFNVDMEHVIRIQHENMNAYWARWTRQPVRVVALISDWGVQWTVLGVLRQFYTLRERQITSKVQAGEYALTCLPTCWHAIIREAIALRETPSRSCYRSRLKRAGEAFRLVNYVIKTCNEV